MSASRTPDVGKLFFSPEIVENYRLIHLTCLFDFTDDLIGSDHFSVITVNTNYFFMVTFHFAYLIDQLALIHLHHKNLIDLFNDRSQLLFWERPDGDGTEETHLTAVGPEILYPFFDRAGRGAKR